MLWAETLFFPALAALSILVAVLSVWTRLTTQRKWRAWLTRHLIERWLATDGVGQLQFRESEDENPEYQIAEDVRVATDAPVSLAAGLLSALLSGVIFIGILWNVGGDLDVTASGHVLTVPKYLVIGVVAYSALLTLTMMFVGRRMIHVIAGKNAAEAEFRSVASRLRKSQMTMRSSDASHRSLNETFNVVIGHWRNLCVQLVRTTLVSHGNTLAAPVLAWMLCAPKFLAGSMSLGEVAQAVAAFVMVQSALNWLVDNYPGLAECLSSVNRVGALLAALDELDCDSEPRLEEAEATYKPDAIARSRSRWAPRQSTQVSFRRA